jgi:hypothetical protein
VSFLTDILRGVVSVKTISCRLVHRIQTRKRKSRRLGIPTVGRGARKYFGVSERYASDRGDGIYLSIAIWEEMGMQDASDVVGYRCSEEDTT